MTKIAAVTARQILDSNARPLLEVDIRTESGHVGRAAAPTGQTTGAHEAVVLRDGDPDDYGGLSVHRAAHNVSNAIAPAIIGPDIPTQDDFDRMLIALDGTPDKSRLGANAIYSASVAFLRAQAQEAGVPVYRKVARAPLTTLPVPAFNLVNGGRSAEIPQPFSEFLVVPVGAENIHEAVQMGVMTFHSLGRVIARHSGRPPQVGRSYGYVAPSSDPDTVLGLMRDAVNDAGYEGRVMFALDCAASQFYDPERETYRYSDAEVTRNELIEQVRVLTEVHDLLFVEDLLAEDDWDGFASARQRIRGTLLLGDDLVVSHRSRLERAIATDILDGFVLKPNQVGTISEALATHDLAVAHGLIVTPSGRAGGVVDDIVMDLAVGLQAPFQKNGAPRSAERIEKLNFLIRASEELGTGTLADVRALMRA